MKINFEIITRCRQFSKVAESKIKTWSIIYQYMNNHLEKYSIYKNKNYREYLGMNLRNVQDLHEENPPGHAPVDVT